MPELPEVQTTVNGINSKAKGLKITDVWTSYDSPYFHGKNDIKNPKYFKIFKKRIVGQKILEAERKGKNVLILLNNGETILTHMKMTGHFMYGKYKFERKNNKWRPAEEGPLADPFNKNIRLLFTLSNGKHLAFADTRKFAKVFVFDKKEAPNIHDLTNLGPDPLKKEFTLEVLRDRLDRRKNWKIKQVLMDQETIAGIGNIYSDEMLWDSGINPLSIVQKIPSEKMKKLYTAMQNVLRQGLKFGGDSASDYRNIHGLPGEFQHKHNVYRKGGKPCPKKDGGIIKRTVVGSRGCYFCPVHQKLYK